MQSEQFDNKVKEAADHHHPAYDEQAWSKMEKLLDKHLPQEEDRKKRFIFFLLIFLLLGGSTWLLISKPWQSSNKIATTDPVSVKNSTTEILSKENAPEQNGTPGTVDNNSTSNNENNTTLPITENNKPANTGNGSLNAQLTKANLVKDQQLIKEKNNETSFAITNGKTKKTAKKEKTDKNINSQPVAEAVSPVIVTNEITSNKKEPADVADTKTVSPKEILKEKKPEKKRRTNNR